jgi:catechol 2,3-dioxygenase-like lactoylglutathione lyase family enzyme
VAIERIGNVFYVVDDMDAAVGFYRDVLGLRLAFQDGDRWAAFDVGGTTLALAAREAGSPATGGGATVSLRVGDVEEWQREAAGRGLAQGEVQFGPHERTVEVTDPDGNRLLVYSPAVESG